ncbi:PPE family protein [Mycobacterium spongiae]|uniref:PPE domain-containing protein n=1 Tax=Mycobacterium spongiae TaxID=886343 RepID=A0A975JVR8_9MYCO|nr:PPE family protein [Mycobacterium spongiae]QUR66585.1 PPE domain-containing protein [Mycobacterium spongiae]
MDFISLPPEITSALIHSGPGAQSLIEASVAWQRLGTDLEDTIRIYVPVLSSAAEAWNGRSSTVMIDAVAPYLTWLRTTAQQCQQLASSAQLAVGAFGSTVSAVVHPSEVTANRVQLARLVATNRLGGNLAAIADTEAQYDRMWVDNSAALYRYQANTAQALALPEFFSPPSIVNPTGAAAQASAVSSASAAPAAATSPVDSILQAVGVTFDPNAGWFGLGNTYLNQWISSGWPVNLLEFLAQNTSAQALRSVAPDIAAGLSEGEAALEESAAGLASASRALSAAGTPTAAAGVAVPMGKISAPPAVVGLLPATQTPVQLASAASPLPAGAQGFPMLPPLMPPPIAAGSGWRKRKQPKYEDLEVGLELKGTIMPRPPSAG